MKDESNASTNETLQRPKHCQADKSGTVTLDEVMECPDELQTELSKVIHTDNLQELFAGQSGMNFYCTYQGQEAQQVCAEFPAPLHIARAFGRAIHREELELVRCRRRSAKV